MKIAFVIHFKTNNAPGIRGFAERSYAERRVLRDGGRLADLHEVNGVFIYWPPERGPFPAATLAQWEQEYDADQAARAARAGADQAELIQAKADSALMQLVNADLPACRQWARDNFPSLTLAEQNRLGMLIWALSVALRGQVRNGAA